MHPIAAFIENPVKVSVGVILVVLFGAISLWGMPIQLAPNIEQPIVTVSTVWPGASPSEVEKEIVQAQEERLRSVEGVVKMSGECRESEGTIILEFGVGTDMEEAVLKVNSQLQRVKTYPLDAERPVIRTSDNSDDAIAWFVLSTLPPDDQLLTRFAEQNPQHRQAIEHILKARSPALKNLRLDELAQQHAEAESLLPPARDLSHYRKYAEDYIKAEFERVDGVAKSDVFGGQIPQMEVLVDADKLAARGLTLTDVRTALSNDHRDTSGGKFDEGKRGWTVRTLGEYRSPDQIGQQIIRHTAGQPVYVRDVAEVRLGYERPTGMVRRFGATNISINCKREPGANVMEIMRGLKAKMEQLNTGRLRREGLVLYQVYDETEYISSAVGLVNQNIMLGGALTIIVMILFLHLDARTWIVVPLLAATAGLAVLWSAWFFILTLAIIVTAGFWYARGTLVVAIAIPTSILGTFIVLTLLGRSLNVISLAGLAFAVGMLVDNAVVVLENIYRHHQSGQGARDAARTASLEVWGAVLASTLTTLFVFLPVLFLEGEVGQLFIDIALAISAAVTFSLLVSIVVIPTAAARILNDHSGTTVGSVVNSAGDKLPTSGLLARGGQWFTDAVCNLNQWIQRTTMRRISTVFLLLAGSLGATLFMRPELEYLPEGNRNLIFGILNPPPGYNIERLSAMGQQIEQRTRPNWDFNADQLAQKSKDFVAIDDFYYVARDSGAFLGFRAYDPLQARNLIPLIREEFKQDFPGTFLHVSQSSLFGRGMSGGRSIDVEIVGPELEDLVNIGGRILGDVQATFPDTTQVRPIPSLDLSSPELHVIRKPEQGSELGISNSELGFVVSTMVDGAYIADYFLAGQKVRLVLRTNDSYASRTQDLQSRYIATRNMRAPVRLDALADVTITSGPQQILRREGQRAVTIQVSPPPELSLDRCISQLNSEILRPLEEDGALGSDYQINLSGTADKLVQTWNALRWNFLLALLITYLLMAALFESWLYPLVIILTVPLAMVGGILGLQLLNLYSSLVGARPQNLDVLTMLGFVILIGTAINNAILLVHQALNLMRIENMDTQRAIIQSVRTRIRPIFMTTLTTVFGLAPLVFFPGAGSELYRGIGSVVFGGLIASAVFTLVMIPALFSLVISVKDRWTGQGS
ncbi:MAG: efflux RND transporter permease subunit [Pirellulaceae bacterium]|nr:efflux RND transporter permease subunit [Pirellulaceae bacterium]